jgi:hypothetical protein
MPGLRGTLHRLAFASCVFIISLMVWLGFDPPYHFSEFCLTLGWTMMAVGRHSLEHGAGFLRSRKQ